MADILDVTVGLAERAAALGVRRDALIIDPGHDFGKNTRHSLEATRRLPEMTATGFPVLVSLSNKDFVGETLDRPVDERLLGTLATTAVSAWLGARIYRAHQVAETRQVLDMVASIRGAVPRRSRGGDWPEAPPSGLGSPPGRFSSPALPQVDDLSGDPYAGLTSRRSRDGGVDRTRGALPQVAAAGGAAPAMAGPGRYPGQISWSGRRVSARIFMTSSMSSVMWNSSRSFGEALPSATRVFFSHSKSPPQ